MRTAIVALIMTLVVAGVMRAQTVEAPGEEFTLSAFILALHIPTTVANADGTRVTTGPVLWFAIRNRTAIPYTLCTAATGWNIGLGGVMGGTSHCSPYWIVLSGETHFQSLSVSIPQEPGTSLGVSVMLEGKPLGSTGDVKRWTLRWAGTVAEATARGEQMKAKIP
jgi:hypothetical protein